MSGPTVVAVVVTFNSAEVITGLLDSLAAGMGELDWRLVVADNDSHDDSVAVVAAHAPAAKIVQVGRNAGYAAGINAAVAAAGPYDAVLILNPDVRLDPGCVPEMLRFLGEPGTGIVVPRLRDGDNGLIYSLRREPTLVRALADALIGARRAGRHGALGEVVFDPGVYTREATPDWAEGSVQLVSAACWDRIGEWDEQFFLYSEEVDYHLRARDAGLGLRYVPTATAQHLQGGSAHSVRLWPLVMTNRVRLFRKRHSLPLAVSFWAVTVFREGTRSVLGHPTSKAALRALLSRRRMLTTPGPDMIARG